MGMTAAELENRMSGGEFAEHMAEMRITYQEQKEAHS